MISRLALVSSLALLAGVAAAQSPRSRPIPESPPTPSPYGPATAKLELVARFPTQQITGIAVSPRGRIFVNLPRWTVDVPISVGEVVGGRIVPFPNAEWNAWRNKAPLDPGSHFVCVQSVVFDHAGRLWALDPAAPGQEGPIKGGPKLVQIDVDTGRVLRVIAFDEHVAIPGSYLNDVRFSPDDRFAYMTDSGARGALVTVDLGSGAAWRVLDGDPSTQVDRGVQVHFEGRVLRRPDGREPQFAADGIALSADGSTLYWQALTGRTLYSLPTTTLQDRSLATSPLGSAVRTVQTTHVADGLWIDSANRLYVSDPEHDAVQVATPGAPLRTLAQDARLRWPDSFAQGPDGAIYISGSHIPDSPWFKPTATTTPSEIWKIVGR